MKKVLSLALALVMVFSLAACFTACNQASGKPATVEDYIASDAMQEQITEIKETVASMGMDIEIKGEGNKLIYVYTYQQDIVLDGMADALASALDAQASTFEAVATSLKEDVGVENPVVVVKYMANDGTEIYSQEFTAK